MDKSKYNKLEYRKEMNIFCINKGNNDELINKLKEIYQENKKKENG